MKSFIFKNLTSFHKIFIKSAICGLALVASGQALATNYYSLSNVTGADLTNGTKWSTINCGSTAVVGTINMVAGDTLGVCNNTSLTLTSSDVVTAGTLAFDSNPPFGVWGGDVVKFNTGNKSIQNGNPSLSPIALNVSAMTVGNTITIQTGQAVTFSGVTGGGLECTTPPVAAFLKFFITDAAAATPYTAGTSIPSGTVCTVTAASAQPVSAPIDLNFSKQPTTFASEVKLK